MSIRTILDDEKLHVIVSTVGMLSTNCILVADKASKAAAIVDAGGDPPKSFMGVISSKKYDIKYILATHGHFDHCCGFTTVKKSFPTAKVAVHEADLHLYKDIPKQPMLFGLPSMGTVPDCELVLKDGQILPLGESDLEVIHTPGHSPGSVLFNVSHGAVLLSGDTLFRGSHGRTDLWEGNAATLKKSFAKFSQFKDDLKFTTVYMEEEIRRESVCERIHTISILEDRGLYFVSKNDYLDLLFDIIDCVRRLAVCISVKLERAISSAIDSSIILSLPPVPFIYAILRSYLEQAVQVVREEDARFRPHSTESLQPEKRPSDLTSGNPDSDVSASARLSHLQRYHPGRLYRPEHILTSSLHSMSQCVSRIRILIKELKIDPIDDLNIDMPLNVTYSLPPSRIQQPPLTFSSWSSRGHHPHIRAQIVTARSWSVAVCVRPPLWCGWSESVSLKHQKPMFMAKTQESDDFSPENLLKPDEKQLIPKIDIVIPPPEGEKEESEKDESLHPSEESLPPFSLSSWSINWCCNDLYGYFARKQVRFQKKIEKLKHKIEKKMRKACSEQDNKKVRKDEREQNEIVRLNSDLVLFRRVQDRIIGVQSFWKLPSDTDEIEKIPKTPEISSSSSSSSSFDDIEPKLGKRRFSSVSDIHSHDTSECFSLFPRVLNADIPSVCPSEHTSITVQKELEEFMDEVSEKQRKSQPLTKKISQKLKEIVSKRNNNDKRRDSSVPSLQSPPKQTDKPPKQTDKPPKQTDKPGKSIDVGVRVYVQYNSQWIHPEAYPGQDHSFSYPSQGNRKICVSVYGNKSDIDVAHMQLLINSYNKGSISGLKIEHPFSESSKNSYVDDCLPICRVPSTVRWPYTQICKTSIQTNSSIPSKISYTHMKKKRSFFSRFFSSSSSSPQSPSSSISSPSRLSPPSRPLSCSIFCRRYLSLALHSHIFTTGCDHLLSIINSQFQRELVLNEHLTFGPVVVCPCPPVSLVKKQSWNIRSYGTICVRDGTIVDQGSSELMSPPLSPSLQPMYHLYSLRISLTTNINIGCVYVAGVEIMLLHPRKLFGNGHGSEKRYDSTSSSSSSSTSSSSSSSQKMFFFIHPITSALLSVPTRAFIPLNNFLQNSSHRHTARACKDCTRDETKEGEKEKEKPKQPFWKFHKTSSNLTESKKKSVSLDSLPVHLISQTPISELSDNISISLKVLIRKDVLKDVGMNQLSLVLPRVEVQWTSYLVPEVVEEVRVFEK
ncbi:hypothetical protein ADUPG1_000318 [Aduncisulcus paluster]|uniref:Metallo-beta-lactamase domain-containing protein n=1 Tax=Aduncisulcus paluster TaxID=2918883 RepID=A0ABQ5K5V6_9EUKA|nr:hypothetical protein ADUPG1_000318 [Aduncisulcus paluster]